MSSPDGVRVRESLFSTSSDRAGAFRHRADDGGTDVDGGAYTENPRSLLQGGQGRHDRLPQARAMTATRKACPPPAGWKSGRGRPWRSTFTRKPGTAQRVIIRAPWTSPVAAHHLAALHIQCQVRGFLLRKERVAGLDPGGAKRLSNTSGTTTEETQRKPRHVNGKRRSRAGNRQLDRYLRSVAENQARGGGAGEEAGGGYSDWCGCRIQAWWRMVTARFKFRYMRFAFYGLAALQIQYAWKTHQQNAIYDMSTRKLTASRWTQSADGRRSPGERGPYRKLLEEREDSAETHATKVIQNCWRRRVAQSIFRYYRNVIGFKLAGDPRLLLRAINPGEAALFDRAAGVHVRFRLGGYTFPPSIYYKVYTHQPVADIGSFAPRAYVEDARDTPGERWNHPPTIGYQENAQPGRIRVGASYFGTTVRQTGLQGTKNWYRRQENNGWRPITIKALSSAKEDPVTIETAETPAVRSGDGCTGSPVGGFHYSKIVREECRVAKMKQRKRRWLRSMYNAGLAEARGATERRQQETWDDVFADRSSHTPYDNNVATPGREPYPGSTLLNDGGGDGGDGGRGGGGSGGGGGRGGRDGSGGGVGGGVDVGAGGGGGGGGGGDGSGFGGCDRGAPGWEQGGYAAVKRGRQGVSSEERREEEDDEGALLVKWSKGLDFDRYLAEWRQIATSGPSEPWRNGDDFAEYVAAKEARMAASALGRSRRQATPIARKMAMAVTPPSSSSSSIPCLD